MRFGFVAIDPVPNTFGVVSLPGNGIQQQLLVKNHVSKNLQRGDIAINDTQKLYATVIGPKRPVK
jgi:hypothetical protein